MCSNFQSRPNQLHDWINNRNKPTQHAFHKLQVNQPEMVKNLYSFIVLFNLDLSGNLEKKFQSVYFVSC